MTVKEKVLLVNEDNHGLIAICADVPTAVDYLINNHWIVDNDLILDYDGKEVSIFAHLGKNWQEKLRSLENWQFNNLFDGWISLDWETVYQS